MSRRSRLATILLVLCGCQYAIGQPVRNWTDSTGKHTTRATLATIKGDIVYLQKEDGQFIAVPVSRLSEIDQTIVAAVHTDKVIVGDVVGVTDGDTITVRAADATYKIRLEAIDAPEGGQDFSEKSKQTLSEKVFGKTVRVEWKSKDKYGRTLGHVLVGDNWINKQMVDEGMAWQFKEYDQSPILAHAEANARAEKSGLWAMASPTPPWEFRHPTEIATATPRGPPELSQSLIPNKTAIAGDVIVYVTASGDKYHNDGCTYLAKSKIAMTLAEAVQGHSPCSKCHPPVLTPNSTVKSDASSALNVAQITTQQDPPAVTQQVAKSPPPPPAASVDRNPNNQMVTGQTATGIPTFTGPRGGVYHYSSSGKKVYEKKK